MKLKNLTIIYILILHTVLLTLARPDLVKLLFRKKGTEHRNEITKYYKTMIAFHLRIDKNVPEGAVLFIGDSLIQGLCVAAVTEKGVNFGIGKDTTLGVLKRIQLYDSVRRAKAIVLAVGINDVVRRRPEEILANYRKIIANIPQTIPVIINEVFPVDQKIRGNELNARIDELNKALKQICSSEKNCFFSKMAAMLTDESGNLRPEFHVGDGIHLNVKGYDLWINELRRKLKEATSNGAD